nr:novel protein [Danio rerio]
MKWKSSWKDLMKGQQKLLITEGLLLRRACLFFFERNKLNFSRNVKKLKMEQRAYQLAFSIYVTEDDSRAASPVIQNIAVVLEEVVVLEDIPDTSSAVAYLFGLLYALNFSYPNELRYTFDTIQNVFMELGTGCTQRVLSLKNKMLN